MFSSLYRRVDYVVRTRSELTEEGGVKRYMCILKAPGGVSDVISFEYSFTRNGIEMKRTD